MEASAAGAKAAGGRTIGVTCSIWKSAANRFIDRSVQTDGLPQRVQRLIELGTAGCVVLPGATGTLVELATVWEMTCKRLRPRRPIVCVGRHWRPLVEMMASARPGCERFVAMIERPDELEQYFPARVQ